MKSELFLVVRRSWTLDIELTSFEWHFFLGPETEGSLCGVPVAAFAEQARAEQHRAKLEETAHHQLGSPARFQEMLAHWTEGPSDDLLLGIMEQGIDPPEPEGAHNGYHWLRWWDEGAPTLTESQRMGLWEVFKSVSFYTVEAIELEE